jgi:hypothetical protein
VEKVKSNKAVATAKIEEEEKAEKKVKKKDPITFDLFEALKQVIVKSV